MDAHEILHADGRVLIFEIPGRPISQPLSYKGCYLMRAGDSLVAMTPDQLKEIFSENTEEWFSQDATESINSDDVINLFDTKIYFQLLALPYPRYLQSSGSRLEEEGFVRSQSGKWVITNLGAILLANDINKFPRQIARKAVRFVLYDGLRKTKTRKEIQGSFGYVVRFQNLVNFVYSEAPSNHILEETLRIEKRMFPKQVLRELIANALIHQDFTITGASVMVEMYANRVEISNPGKPVIDVSRFIDSYKSRNEKLADVMRRFGVCEEKGSGIDKVIEQIEVYQLPAPDFRTDGVRTIVVLFAHIDFLAMTKKDRIRACYQHCCLRYVFNENMTNSSLRKRFRLTDWQTTTASQIIASTRDAGLIKNVESGSTRYARYLPWWA